jgi:hypothetical protein
MKENIDKRLLKVFIPCTEQKSTEVYGLLEQAGLSCSNHEADKDWTSNCDGVETYYDGDFQSYFKSKSEYPELTLKELREIVSKTPLEPMNTEQQRHRDDLGSGQPDTVKRLWLANTSKEIQAILMEYAQSLLDENATLRARIAELEADEQTKADRTEIFKAGWNPPSNKKGTPLPPLPI